MTENKKEVAIIGSGLMGATLAYQYAKNHPDHHITIYEQQAKDTFLGHRQSPGYSAAGSQPGDQTTRSIRGALSERNRLGLAVDTRELYEELQAISDEPVFVGNPSIMVINLDKQSAVDKLALHQKRYTQEGFNHTVYDNVEALVKDHPECAGLVANANYPANYKLLYEDGFDPTKNPNGVSGLIDPGALLRTVHKKLADMPNVSLQYEARIDDIGVDTKDDGRGTVSLADGQTQTFDNVVIAAGSWLQRLQNRMPGIPEIVPNRVAYAEIPCPQFTQRPALLKGVGASALPAHLSPQADGTHTIKILLEDKTRISADRDDILADHPFTPEEIAEAIDDIENVKGIKLTQEQKDNMVASSCVVGSSHGLRAVMGRVEIDGVSAEKSPIIVHGYDNHAMACLCGGAAKITSAVLDGKAEPYQGAFAEHAPYNPLQFPENAQVPASAKALDKKEPPAKETGVE